MLVPVHQNTLAVTTISTNTLTIATLLSMGGEIDALAYSPAALAVSQNNYDPTEGVSTNKRPVYRLAAAAASAATGMLAGSANEQRILVNTSAFTVTLSHNSGSSAAGNKFLCPAAADFEIPTLGGCRVWYDGTTSAWRVVEAAAGLPATITGSHTFSGTILFANDLAANASLTYQSRIYPATLASGDTSNYAPSGYDSTTSILIDPDPTLGSRLTGIVATSGRTSLIIQNIGTAAAAALTLAHDAVSTAANRFLCPDLVDFRIGPGGGVQIIYDNTGYARWRVVA